MEVLTTEGRAVWVSNEDEIRPRGGLPLIESVRRLAETFSFATVPRDPNDMTFTEGAYEVQPGRTVAIANLKIYSDGFAVQTHSTTEDADVVVGEVLRLAQHLGMRAPKTPPLILHQSVIVVDLARDIDHLLAPQIDLLRNVHEALPSYSPRNVVSLTLAADPATLPARLAPHNPTVFRIERRVGVEHSLNRYFSMAHATTDQHLEALRRIERLLPSDEAAH